MAHLGALIMEALEEALQQFIGIVDPLGVLAHNPDHGSPGLGLIQGVQILTQCGDHTLVPRDPAHSWHVSTEGGGLAGAKRDRQMP